MASQQNLQNLENLQRILELEYKECEKSVNNQIKKLKRIVDFKDICQIVDQIVKGRVNADLSQDMRDRIISSLIGQQAFVQIGEIKKYWMDQLTHPISKINFRVDFKRAIQEIKAKFPQPSAEKVISVLVDQIKNPQYLQDIREKSEFNYTNYFMIGLSSALHEQVDVMFENLNFSSKEYRVQMEETKMEIDNLIYRIFKTNYEELDNDISSFLNEQEQYKLLYIMEIVNKELPKVNDKLQSDLQNSENSLKLFISKLYTEELQDQYKTNQPIFYLLIEKQLQQTLKKAEDYYLQQIAVFKQKLLEEYQTLFIQIMNRIKNKIFSLPFQQCEQEKYLLYLLIENFKVRNDQERFQVINFLFYLSSFGLIQESDMNILSAIENSQIQEFSELKNKKEFRVSENATKFINYLKSILEDKDKFYLLLVQIYMLVTNIEVKKDKDQITIDILPYLGFFSDLKSRVVESLYLQLGLIKEIPLFFNYLDSYFEENNQHYKSERKSEINKNENQSIEFLLKRNFDYSKEYYKQLEDAFHQKFSLLKHSINIKIPDSLYLVRVSPPQIRSRHIIIAISGFTSQEDDKQLKWQNLGKLYPNSEVYALQYNSQTEKQLIDSIKYHLLAFFSPVGKFFKALSLFNLTQDNLFSKASNEAVTCGKYLAQLIYNGHFFPNSSISLIGFSLGTHVIQELLIEYKKLIDKNNTNSMIASVILMGGVACSQTIKEANLIDVISHKLYNCYSKNDSVLKYIFRAIQLKKKPVGVNELKYDRYDQKNKVVNKEFTNSISSHEEFMNKYSEVLQEIDYQQEFINMNALQNIFLKYK